jgi:hypothetical protein
MDIRAYSAIQIQSDKGLTKKSSVRSSGRKPAAGTSPDEVNLAERAASISREFQQVDETKGLTGDLDSIDTPAHARQAAEHITKYGP